VIGRKLTDTWRVKCCVLLLLLSLLLRKLHTVAVGYWLVFSNKCDPQYLCQIALAKYNQILYNSCGLLITLMTDSVHIGPVVLDN